MNKVDSDISDVASTTSKSTTAMSRIGSTFKSVGATIAGTALNIGADLLIAGAISGVVKLFDHIATAGAKAQQTAIQTGATAFEEFATQKTELQNMAGTIDSTGERFIKLRKGVNALGHNMSLTTDEFAEYNQLATQIGNTMPNLVRGYTALGTPIIKATSDVSDLTTALSDQESTLRKSTITNKNDLLNSYNAKNNHGALNKNETAGLKQQKAIIDNLTESYDEYGKSINATGHSPYEDGTNFFINMRDSLLGNSSSLNAQIRTQTDNTVKQIGKELDLDVTNWAGEVDWDVVDENIDKFKDYTATIQEAQNEAIKEAYPLIESYIGETSNYKNLSNDAKSAMSSIVSSIDAEYAESKFFTNGDLDGNKINKWADNLTTSLSKPGVQDKLVDFLSFDENMDSMTYQDYVQELSQMKHELTSEVPDLTLSQLDDMSGFDDQLQNLKAHYDQVEDVVGDNVDNLSNGDLEIAYNLVVNDEFSGTFDQLLNEIALVKEAQFDIYATPLLDAATVAKESKNAGDAYLQMASDFKTAKEMYDQGLVGTDDFKSIAKYLSPSGADDATNFEENYGKAMRYFTVDSEEDGTKAIDGVQNFLNDLESKGFATLTETVDENGEAIEQWKYNITDLEDAAQNMGIGFEPFMAMFGRLNDYGFSNNFVSSIEQGEEHISGLTQELADAEKHLAELQQPGQYQTNEAEELGLDGTFGNQTAIDAQKAKVDELRNSIVETQGAMSQLLQRSAQDRIVETENAKLAIQTLKEERQKVLNGEGEYASVEQNTRQSIADQIEDDINQWAAEKSIKLDAELNIEEPETSDLKDSSLKGSPVLGETQSKESIKPEIPDYSTEIFNPIDNVIKIPSEVEKPKVPNFSGIVPTVEIPSEIQKPGSPELPKIKQEIEPIPDYSEEIFFPAKIQPEITTPNESIEISVNEVQGTEIEPEDKEATVIYDTDTSDPDSYEPSNEHATVNYTANASAINSWTPPAKTGTVKYTAIFSPGGLISANKGFGGANGTAHVAGTTSTPKISGSAFNDGTIGNAYSSGDWSIKKGSNSLVGELGQEIVVRNGRYFTIGDHGTEFFKTQPGDIIFNHKQSESLLNNGYVTGRGKLIGGNAHSDGTAYAGGSGGGSFQGGASNSNSSSSSADEENTASAANSAASAAKSAADSAESTKEAMDYIEIKLDNLTHKTERYLQYAENAVSLTGSLNNYQSAIKSIQNHAAVNWEAEQAYFAKAESVNLDASIKQKVRDGAIIIEDYDEDIQTKIGEYQKWYDKIIECKDASIELKIQQEEIAQQKLDTIIDYYDSRTSLYQNAVSTQNAKMEYRDSMGFVRHSTHQENVYKSQLTQENSTLKTTEEALSKYQSELNKQVNDGIIKKNGIAWYEAQQQIEEYKNSIYESKTAINNLNEQIRTINFTAFQSLVDIAARWIDKLASVLSLKEARGITLNENDYRRQINANNGSISRIYDQRNAFAEEQKRYSVNSEKYQDLADKIASADNEILQLLTDNEALKDSIREARWKPFEDAQEKISFMSDEVDNLLDMFNSRSLIDDDTGVFKDEAYASLALSAQAMDLQGQKIADYREALEKLDQELSSGNITQDEYNEQSREFIEIIQNSVNSIQDYKDAISDLYITQAEKQNELLQEEIDLRQEALNKKKSYYDYDKQLSNSNKDINSLLAQISALKGVSSAAGKAELARLQEQLTTAKEEREDIVVEHEYEILSDGYDGLSDNANQALEELTEAIENNADVQNQIVSAMLDSLKEKYGTAFTEIAQIIKDSGLIVSDALTNQLNDYQNATDTSNKINNSQTNPGDKSSSSSASNINTDTITTGNSTTSKAESVASQQENRYNRKIVSMKLDKTSVSIKVGKTAIIKVKEYLPSDATVDFKWVSGNPSIALVSNGTVTGKKAGSTIVTCTDNNSGKKATCKIIVANAASTLIAKTNILTSASSAARTVATLASGTKVNIGESATDRVGAKWLKVSSGSKTGWVKTGSVKKYAKGTLNSSNELAEINDGSGDELVFRYNGHDYTNLTKGSKVLTAQQTENLVKLSDMKSADIIENLVPGTNSATNINNHPSTINVHIDSMIGNINQVNKDTLPDLEVILKKSYQYTTDHLKNELKKFGLK